MDGGGEGAPWWLAGGLGAMWVVREFVAALLARQKNRTETDANIELINSLRQSITGMDERFRAMETTQTELGKRLDQEIAARQAAQEEAHWLKMRVQTLEAEMRRLGVVIPPEVRP